MIETPGPIIRRLFVRFFDSIPEFLTKTALCYTIKSIASYIKERHMVSLTVAKQHEGQELFDLLADTYPDFSKKAIKTAFKKRFISVNGQDAVAGDAVNEGDVVHLYIPGDILGLDLMPTIVYQDENIIVVDKPAGLLSRSDTGEVNAVDMVEYYMKKRGEYNLGALMVPYLLYPLDEYVSGLLVMAKHEDAYLFLAEALSQRRISRYYYCAVQGQAKESDELLGYHFRDKAGKRVQILSKYKKDSKPIVTRYQRLAEGETISLISARPLTNMLHQVRAHLAFGGLPVLGDDTYGNARFNKKCGAEFICLWLKSLVFEVGTGHGYTYLNGMRFESVTQSFPRCVYEQGLLDGIEEDA
jgi:RluA family pseudouridine synthase